MRIATFALFADRLEVMAMILLAKSVLEKIIFAVEKQDVRNILIAKSGIVGSLK